MMIRLRIMLNFLPYLSLIKNAKKIPPKLPNEGADCMKTLSSFFESQYKCNSAVNVAGLTKSFEYLP